MQGLSLILIDLRPATGQHARDARASDLVKVPSTTTAVIPNTDEYDRHDGANDNEPTHYRADDDRYLLCLVPRCIVAIVIVVVVRSIAFDMLPPF